MTIRTCGDNSCIFGHTGQGTNGGCRCIPLKMTPDDRARLRANIRALREQRDASEAARRELRNEAKLALNRLRRLVGDDIPAALAIAAMERLP